METVGSLGLWAGFAVDRPRHAGNRPLLVGGGKEHRVSFKEAAVWSVIWISVTLAFAGGLWWHLDGAMGREIANTKALEFITGYLIEKALAVNNVFVWLMLFSFFAVPAELQKRVSALSACSALSSCAPIMIFAGAWLITQFHWILYIFGAFLLITGVKMYWFADEKPDLENNKLVKWMRGHMNISTEFDGERFFTWKNGVRYATPLFLALVLVEVSDLIFAVELDPGHLRDHDRSVHRPDLEHLRHPWPARDVLPARRRRRPFLAAQVRAGHRPDVHRRQDAADRHLQDSGRLLAGRGRGDHRRLGMGFAAQGSTCQQG